MFIALSISVSKEEILQKFKDFFPVPTLEDYDSAVAREPFVMPDIAISVIPVTSNFPTYIDIMWFMKSVSAPYEISIELARLLSIYFKCSTVCDPGPFQPEDKPDDPYYVIIWKDGQAYLGSDAEFDLDEGGNMNILHPINVPPRDLQSLITEWERTLR